MTVSPWASRLQLLRHDGFQNDHGAGQEDALGGAAALESVSEVVGGFLNRNSKVSSATKL